MRSVVEVDIDLPQARVAELFSDPRNSVQWMEDLERYEPISGTPGMPGSTYRLVSKSGKLDFVATVLTRNLPGEAKLALDSHSVAVTVTGRFVPRSDGKTRLISEEEFRFKGIFGRIFGRLAKRKIDAVHRQQMLSFQHFAEAQE
jgi:hypothetical protein